jgi:hypothetical protein
MAEPPSAAQPVGTWDPVSHLESAMDRADTFVQTVRSPTVCREFADTNTALHKQDNRQESLHRADNRTVTAASLEPHLLQQCCPRTTVVQVAEHPPIGQNLRCTKQVQPQNTKRKLILFSLGEPPCRETKWKQMGDTIALTVNSVIQKTTKSNETLSFLFFIHPMGQYFRNEQRS